MNEDSFQLWYYLIHVAGKALESRFDEVFWSAELQSKRLGHLEGKYDGADLAGIWTVNVEPRLEKVAMNPDLRKKFLLPGKSTCRAEGEKVRPECGAAREAAREKLARFRIGQQTQLLEKERPDWPGRNWGFPEPEDAVYNVQNRTRLKLQSSRAHEIKRASLEKGVIAGSRLSLPTSDDYSGTNPSLFEMENGEKMRFFFFRDNCDMGVVYETVKEMKGKIEIRGGYVHKFWSDAQRDPYSITLICDKYPWHKSWVKQESRDETTVLDCPRCRKRNIVHFIMHDDVEEFPDKITAKSVACLCGTWVPIFELVQACIVIPTN